MLYELHDIQAWKIDETEAEPTLNSFINTCCEKAYRQVNQHHCIPFMVCNPIPTISFNGDYVAVYDSSCIKILERGTEFSVLHKIELGLEHKSQINWSLNSNNLGVSVDKSEVIIFNLEGNEICKSKKADVKRMIGSFYTWLDNGYHFLMLSDDRLQLTHYIHNNMIDYMFEFNESVLEVTCLVKIGRIVTTHLSSLG